MKHNLYKQLETSWKRRLKDYEEAGVMAGTQALKRMISELHNLNEDWRKERVSKRVKTLNKRIKKS